jgi:hypothetical protein
MDRQRGIMPTVRRFDAFLFYQALDGCVNRSRTRPESFLVVPFVSIE